MGINIKKNLNNYNDDELMNLTNQLIEANSIIETQKKTIKDLQEKLNKYNNYINNYQNMIKQKDMELNNLKLQLNKNVNNNVENSSSKIYANEMMCVNFISMDQNVHFAVPCTKKDIFAEVEEKLYKKFPEYRGTNNSFIANGTQVLRFKTIGENKIGNGLPVTLVLPA